MSKYTTELRYIIESGFDLGLKDYPVISEEYRIKLNEKIFNHYWFHEIGFETANRFKHYLNTTMNEIMAYYNQMLKSELLKINPLLSFERSSISSKNNETKSDEEKIDSINKDKEMNTTRDNETNNSKSTENKTQQEINNNTSLDNLTDSNTQENQNSNSDVKLSNDFLSSKNIDGNNTGTDNQVFYDTPNGSLGDITDSTYATNVTKRDSGNIIDENETMNTNENSNKNENSNTNSQSNTVNKTKTDTTSNTTNSTTNNIIETGNIDSNESINTTDNEEITSNSDITKSTLSNENNVVSENGYEIPLTELLLKYRETFLNIDLMIIEELKDLFMMIY